MICDPPPAPDLAPMPDPTAEVALPIFEARDVQIISGRVPDGIEVRGTVTNRQGNPMRQIRLALAAPGIEISSRTDKNGAFSLRFSTPGSYRMFIGIDRDHSVLLELKLNDLALVEWREAAPASWAPLPLAEIRSVKIAAAAADPAFAQGLGFVADSPWPGAGYRWSVSGGTLVEAGAGVIWQPPAGAGRYLLQVIADWDFAGLAVDAAVLTVAVNGQVSVS